MKPVLELRNHENEVWYLKYSHDGTMLASASKDNTVVIYETTNYKVKFHLKEHEAGISHLAWSSDDTKLISCCTSRECSAKIWDVKVCHVHDYAAVLISPRLACRQLQSMTSHTPLPPLRSRPTESM